VTPQGAACALLFAQPRPPLGAGQAGASSPVAERGMIAGRVTDPRGAPVFAVSVAALELTWPPRHP